MSTTPIASGCSTGSPNRVPELDLDREQVEWTRLDDGHEALLVNGGGFDGGSVIRVEWLSGPEAFLAVIAAVLIPLGSWRWGG